jgi:hypothetical protein
VQVRDELTVLESDLVRRQLGVDMNFEGFDLDHITFEGDVVYRNAWQGGRLADDEIAVASVLERMGVWMHDDGPAPYPLADRHRHLHRRLERTRPPIHLDQGRRRDHRPRQTLTPPDEDSRPATLALWRHHHLA